MPDFLSGIFLSEELRQELKFLDGDAGILGDTF